MSEKVLKAKELFSNNFNCSQSTLCVFADELGLTFQQATNISAGFGAGMCYQGKTCGAVTGAYIALGLVSGKQFDEPEMVKENTYQLIKKFNAEFGKLHSSIECKDLLGIDISTTEGVTEGRKKELFTKRCPLFVADAVKLLEKEIIKQ